ncbi:MAG: hypothetical protein FWG67_08620 [Defluviitaleaceae bacterium]|nr:hypothetical protein [Defluviitaleaceae bacterium]
MKETKKLILSSLVTPLIVGSLFFLPTSVVEANTCTQNNSHVGCTVLSPEVSVSGQTWNYRGRIQASRSSVGSLWARVDSHQVGQTIGGSAGTITGSQNTPVGSSSVTALSVWVMDRNDGSTMRTIGRTSN